MTQAGADGAYLYSTAAAGTELGCFVGLRPAGNGGSLGAIAAQLPLKSGEIVILSRSNSGNSGREFLPEPFESAAVIALMAGGQRQGILILGRVRGYGFEPGELGLL
jgi:hypothetical protein